MTLVRSIYARRFRSLKDVEVLKCGTMNVLIGRNNAGKSTILSALDLAFSHLQGGKVARPWERGREQELFTDRDSRSPAQLGFELTVPDSIRKLLEADLAREAPQLQKTLQEIPNRTPISLILSISTLESTIVFVERLALGSIVAKEDGLTTDGTLLLAVPLRSAHRLAEHYVRATELRQLAEGYRELRQSRELPEAIKRNERDYIRYMGRSKPVLLKDVFKTTEGREAKDWTSLIDNRLTELEIQVDSLKPSAEVETFGGKSLAIPVYVDHLMEQYGAMTVLRLGERRDPIGPPEAKELLELKVRRGGSERLKLVQDTVQSLLGVRIDAFQPERRPGVDAEGRRSAVDAELDVDEFLIEANGAGVREALRLILDIELKAPDLVLLEEPEVHLHPGLERALEGYLRRRSEDCQMFVTTHSTSFVDAVEFQNVYVVRRNKSRHTECNAIGDAQEVWQIPAEIGLRLSTLFMFERLVFVEGPSDESILRQFALTADIDLARYGVGFVHMGGIRNFAHYAAQATLDVLGKRSIPMCFVVDRDEKDDADVDSMIKRLGSSAKLIVLQRRELENYLLDPAAIATYLIQSPGNEVQADAKAIRASLNEIASSMLEEVTKLWVGHKVLAPVFPNRRELGDDIREKLIHASDELEHRLETLDQVHVETHSRLGAVWDSDCLSRAPGSLVLDRVLQKWDRRYRRERGDGQRIAKHIPKSDLDNEILRLLRDISGQSVAVAPSFY